MSDWQPGLYPQFGRERTQPSIDLTGRIELDSPTRQVLGLVGLPPGFLLLGASLGAGLGAGVGGCLAGGPFLGFAVAARLFGRAGQDGGVEMLLRCHTPQVSTRSPYARLYPTLGWGLGELEQQDADWRPK